MAARNTCLAVKGKSKCWCQKKIQLICPESPLPLITVRVLHSNVTITCESYSPEALDAGAGLELGRLGLHVLKIKGCPPPRGSYRELADSWGLEYLSMLELSGYAEGASLDESHFSGLEDLLWLTISDSELASLPSSIFSRLVSLKHLNISYNRIDSIPDGLFLPLVQLLTLTVSERGLRVLHKRVFTDKHNNMHVLHLDENGLTQLVNDNFRAVGRSVHTISIRDNLLSHLHPRSFNRTKRLLFLMLQRNRIESLPDGLFSDCVSLIRLDLSYNLIQQLPRAIFDSNPWLRTLFLNDNRLKMLSGRVFHGLKKLEELRLYNNSLGVLEPDIFASFERVANLQLSGNKLNDTGFLVPLLGLQSSRGANLRWLRLESNRLTRLPEQVLELLNKSTKLQYIGLANNPWICDCDVIPTAIFLHQNARKVSIQEIRCENGSTVVGLDPSRVCASGVLAWALVSSMSALIGILALAVATLYFKYREEIAVWLYSHKLCLWGLTEEQLDRDKKYDAFLCYASEDHQFVVEQLLPVLEGEGVCGGYRLCLHYRDWIVGEFISSQIVRSVQESRRSIVVVSDHFLRSVWAKMELRTAHWRAVSEGRLKLIVIMYQEQLDPSIELDPELKAYLTSRTYLKWSDPWFWQKLAYALPHKRTTIQNRG